LASHTIVTIIANTISSGTIAFTLIGALSIVVGRVRDGVKIGILHSRELFSGTVWPYIRVLNEKLIR
jgi:hypothetical protein